MTKDMLPQTAMKALAEFMEVKKPSTITDVRTHNMADPDKVTISVTVTKTITQAQLAGLVK